MFKRFISVLVAFSMALTFGFSSFVESVSAEQTEQVTGLGSQFEEMSKDFDSKTKTVSKKVEKDLTNLVEKNYQRGKLSFNH